MKKLDITQKRVARHMSDRLLQVASENNVDLTGINTENWQHFLDDAFKDGGETRCESFADISDEYAMQFGEFESIAHLTHRYNACIAAIKLVMRDLNKKSN